MRVLELFSGIGAVAVAATNLPCEIVAAIDINQNAARVYRENFTTPVLVADILSLSAERLTQFDTDLWWMSPPCQPYTRRGLQRDIDDPRAKPLLHLIDMIGAVQPTHIALENVVGFEKSESFQRLSQTLSQNGYDFASLNLCSTMFGLPNLRPRFFLLASRQSKIDLQPPGVIESNTVEGFLDIGQDSDRESLQVPTDMIQKYRTAINVCTPSSRSTRCFTSAYGRSLIRSGSYLETENGFRRFSPREVSRLLGFPNSFQLPNDLTTPQLYRLLGNSISVPCARWLLGEFLEKDGKARSAFP